MSGSQSNHKASQEALEKLHADLADHFSKALRGEEVPPSLVNAARQFLKDNHIEAAIGKGQIHDILDGVPTFDEDLETGT